MPASSTKAAPSTALSAVTIIPAIGKPMRSAAVSGTDSAEFGDDQVALPDDGGDDGGLGRAEEEGHRGDREGDRVDEADVDLERQRHEQHEEGADEVAGDHRAAAVPSVHEHAGERTQEDARDRGHREDDADLERGAAGRDERAERDDVDPVADQRDQLAGPQQAEVAVREQAQVRRLAPQAGGLGSGLESSAGMAPDSAYAAPAVPGVAVAARRIVVGPIA